jgi:hypothetical protein
MVKVDNKTTVSSEIVSHFTKLCQALIFELVDFDSISKSNQKFC